MVAHFWCVVYKLNKFIYKKLNLIILIVSPKIHLEIWYKFQTQSMIEGIL
jgi:hypothetical protein